MEVKNLGRYLGPSFDVGDALCAKILTKKGSILNRTSYFRLSDEDNNSEVIKKRKLEWDETLKENLVKKGKMWETVNPSEDDQTPMDFDKERMYGKELSDIGDMDLVDEILKGKRPGPGESDDDPTVETVEDGPDIVEADDIQHEAFDKHISAKVCLPRGDNMAYGTVLKRKRDADGELVGKSNANPLLDTSTYEVKFDDGEVDTYSANLIAEHVYSQVDDDGYNYYVFDEIIDHQCDETALFGDGCNL